MMPSSRRLCRTAAALLIAGALGACSLFTPPPPTCPQTSDWRAYGQWEVMQGRGQGWAQRHARVCAENGQTFDQAAWLQGWQQGLATFCTPENGAAWGKAGKSYDRGFCPAALEPQFLASYTPAHAHWKFSRNLRHRQQELDEHTRQLNDVIRQQARPGLAPDARAELRARQQVLENTIRNLRSQMQTEVLIHSTAPHSTAP